LTGIKGKFDAAENVFKISLPRSDLKVTVAEAKMTPPMGLTSWAAFKAAGNQAMVMGDLVLLEDQVNPVMSAALAWGLQHTSGMSASLILTRKPCLPYCCLSCCIGDTLTAA
jgi:hypothetical protein